MCCGTGSHHGGRYRGHHHGCDCGCGCGGGHSHFERRFLTKEEKAVQLEQYLESLQAEAQAVEERIVALKAEA